MAGVSSRDRSDLSKSGRNVRLALLLGTVALLFFVGSMFFLEWQ